MAALLDNDFLPTVLLIDDQFGASIADRRNLCLNFGLIDITGDDHQPEEIIDPVAKACFCRGQVVDGDLVHNDVLLVREAIKRGWPHRDGWRWSMVLLDIRFVSGKVNGDGIASGNPGDSEFGLVLLRDIRSHYPEVPVVMLSSRDRNKVILECREAGALDFIQRVGFLSGELTPKDVLRKKIHDHGLVVDNRRLDNEAYRIVGKSLKLLQTLRSARRAATGSGNILLLGETGTGKELLARYIHDISVRSGGVYKVYNPHGSSETLQEDALFGHEKGAFTGAYSARKGLFELAEGGTLFIDEIGDIPKSLQNKLLRPLENREVSRQGGNVEKIIDLQVVLGTNKDLRAFAEEGRFKIDLLNRINAYPVTLPPLRERKSDLPLLTNHLLKHLCYRNRARWPRTISPEAFEKLMNYHWPGNIRELRNVLEQVVKNNPDSELLVSDDIMMGEPFSLSTVNDAVLQKSCGIERFRKLLDVIAEFEFPADYDELEGWLPQIQSVLTEFFAKYVLAAVKTTVPNKPGVINRKVINLTGAVSCMEGRQLTTQQARDMVKRLLKWDEETKNTLVEKDLLLARIWEEALKRRKDPKKL